MYGVDRVRVVAGAGRHHGGGARTSGLIADRDILSRIMRLHNLQILADLRSCRFGRHALRLMPPCSMRSAITLGWGGKGHDGVHSLNAPEFVDHAGPARRLGDTAGRRSRRHLGCDDRTALFALHNRRVRRVGRQRSGANRRYGGPRSDAPNYRRSEWRSGGSKADVDASVKHTPATHRILLEDLDIGRVSAL